MSTPDAYITSGPPDQTPCPACGCPGAHFCMGKRPEVRTTDNALRQPAPLTRDQKLSAIRQVCVRVNPAIRPDEPIRYRHLIAALDASMWDHSQAQTVRRSWMSGIGEHWDITKDDLRQQDAVDYFYTLLCP